jgi:hypothetical protein
VTIRDTVEIQKPTSVATELSSKQSLASGSPVAPFDGWLRIFYFGNAYRFQVPFDSSDSLNVFVNETLAAQDALLGRYEFSSDTLARCELEGANAQYTEYAHIDTADTWQPIRVKQGDQIDFTAAIGTPSYTQFDTNLWSVKISELCPTGIWNSSIDFGVSIDQDTLDLQIDEPKEVWPDILKEHFPASNQEFDPSTVRDTTDATVTLEVGGSRISDEDVLVHAEWIQESGGHYHGSHPDFECSDTGEKALPLGWMKFKDLAIPSTVQSDSITGTTDSNGEVKVRFYAPRWGGQVAIHAEVDYNGVELTDSDTLTVRVPGLMKLPVSPDYVKLGGTGRHPGPDDNCFNGGTSNFAYEPDFNHWATPQTITELLAINSEWSSKPGNHKLWINDMSLPFGGQFDVNGDWERPHRFHRLGRDVDIRITRDSTQSGVFVKTLGSYVQDGKTKLIVKNEDFDRLSKRITGVEALVHSPGDPNNEHYHIYFYR